MGMNSEISTYTISIFELKEYNFDFGLNDYAIFDEAYRATLNNAILDFYMFREIGFVNPAVFRFKLRARMDLLMRNKYNQLYKAKQIEFNPLYNVEMHETFTHNVSNDTTTNSNGELNYNTSGTIGNTNTQTNNINTSDNTTNDSNNLGLTSQFPSEEMTEDDLTSNLFIDNANKTKGNTTVASNSEVVTIIGGTTNTTNVGIDKTVNVNEGTTNNTTQETYSKDTVGSSAGLPFSRAMTQLKDYLDEFQLDQQVIDELKDLFMQIW